MDKALADAMSVPMPGLWNNTRSPVLRSVRTDPVFVVPVRVLSIRPEIWPMA